MCSSNLRSFRSLLAAGLAAASLTVGLSQTATADDHHGWHGGDNRWHGGGDIHRFHEYDLNHWRGGRWWNGWHDGRMGWWWIIGPTWYWYPQAVYPYPNPYVPPVVAVPPTTATYYYCANPAGYYPYVATCLVPWQPVPAAAPPVGMAPAPVAPMAPAPAPSSSGIDNSTGGTVLGAIGGGVAGAQFGHGSGKLAAVAAGTLLGAFVGHEVGQSLDRADAVAARQAERNAYQAPLGQSITWSNPENGHSGTFTPVRDGRDSGGNYCREFQQNVVVDGQATQAYGTACRQPDGSWKVVGQ